MRGAWRFASYDDRRSRPGELEGLGKGDLAATRGWKRGRRWSGVVPWPRQPL